MKDIVKKILELLARFFIVRYRPTIIAVTGSVGKTSTKEAIAAVVRHSGRTVRASKGNLNNEFGVPLTILGNWSEQYYQTGGSPLFWCKVIVSGMWRAVVPHGYPRVLVLEFGADHPGDILALVRAYRPDIAVITTVGEIPVHVEYYDDAGHVAREKSELVKHLANSGYAVLNYDDPKVLEMRNTTKGHAVTFGADEHAEIYFSHLGIYYDQDEAPAGIVFKLHYNGSFVPIKIAGSLGSSQAYAMAAAAGVGVALGINLIEISQAFEQYRRPLGRLRILPGIKHSTIIDDTYNASPAAVHLALDTLKSIPKGRKVAVLGDMLELGKYSIQAHQKVGNQAGDIASVLVCVGERAKFIADTAANQMSAENIFTFHTSDEAKAKVQELMKERDVVLVKGSQGIRMEKIVKEIMAEPLCAKELLVRQNEMWLQK